MKLDLRDRVQAVIFARPALLDLAARSTQRNRRFANDGSLRKGIAPPSALTA